MNHRRLAAVAAALATLACAQAGTDYTFISVGYQAWGYGIDNDGNIVYQMGSYDSYLRRPDGSQTKMAYPNSGATIALGMNNVGQIVGDRYDAAIGNYVGFLRSATGQYSTVFYPQSNGMQVGDINDQGEIVGSYYIDDYHRGSFVRSPNGAFTTFPQTYANGINNDGQVVGQSYLRQRNGTIIHLTFPGGGVEAFGINNVGEIVGRTGNSGFVREPNGTYRLVNYPGAASTMIWSINDRGMIVGTFHDRFGTSAAFIGTPNNIPPLGIGDTYEVAPNVPLDVPAAGVLKNDLYSPDSAVLLTPPSHGSLTLSTTGGFVFQPKAGFIGTDSFTYIGVNETGESDPVTVTLRVRHAYIEGLTLFADTLWIPQDAAAGDTTIGAVTVVGNVPEKTVIRLSDGDTPSIAVAPSLALPAGASRRTFTFPVTSQGPWHTDNSSVRISATLNGMTRSVLLKRRVLPQLLSSGSGFASSEEYETYPVPFRVQLDYPAPTGGKYAKGIPVRVYQIGNTAVFKFPNTPVGDTANPPQFSTSTSDTNLKGVFVTVPPGQSSAEIVVGLRHSPSLNRRSVVANFRNVGFARSILIKPILPVAHSVEPLIVDTPGTFSGSVTMNHPIGPVTYGSKPLDNRVYLFTADPVTVPWSVRIPVGADGVTYTGTSGQVAVAKEHTVTAVRGNGSMSAILTLLP